MDAETTYRRGRLDKACDPWPRGQVMTTDARRAGNPPGGPAPVFVDPRRFAALEATGHLVDAEDVGAGDPAGDERPDAFDREAGGQGEAAGVSVHVHVDPTPVPADDPRLKGGE